MSGRCRNCGRRYTRSTRTYRRHGHGRRHRTVFSQIGFWGWVVILLAVVWLADYAGVIGS